MTKTLKILALVVALGFVAFSCWITATSQSVVSRRTTATSTPLTVDATAGEASTTGASYALAFTVTSETNRFIVAGSVVGDGTAGVDSVVWVQGTTRQPFAVITYQYNSGGDFIGETYGIVAPNSGAGYITYYWKVSTSHCVGAISFYNAKQTGQFSDTASAQTDGATSLSASITSSAGEIVVDCMGAGTATWTRDASQTSITAQEGTYEKLRMSYKADPVTSMTYATGASSRGVLSAIRIKPL